MTQALNPDPTDKAWRVTVSLTLCLYVLLQILYVTATPLEVMTLPDNLPRSAPQSLTVGIGPDEREHFLYALSLANRGELPRPAPRWRTSPAQYVTYQAQHPPIFYAVAALLLKATPGLSPSATWYVLRGFCVLCGAVVIVLSALAARAAFPDRPIVGLATAPFVAFLPMFGHVMGNLSNEPMAMALTAWAWLQMVRLARGRSLLTVSTAALLGITLGVAAETRMTAVMWLPAALLILGYAGRRPSTRPVLPIATFLLCFLVLTLPWFLHNQIAYGTPVLRPFDRPMLQGHSLAAFIADPAFPTVARLTALWYASTAWTPFWLTQFYWPGGVRQEGGWQSLFLLADVFALLALFLHASRAKRRRRRRIRRAGRCCGRRASSFSFAS